MMYQGMLTLSLPDDAAANRLQRVLLYSLFVLCALQVPLSDIAAVAASIDDSNRLEQIANSCAWCSLALLCLPFLWALHQLYEMK